MCGSGTPQTNKEQNKKGRKKTQDQLVAISSNKGIEALKSTKAF